MAKRAMSQRVVDRFSRVYSGSQHSGRASGSLDTASFMSTYIGTRKPCADIVARLLHQKFAKRPVEIAKLRPHDVRKFLASRPDTHGRPSHASELAWAVRSYLRYRTTCGDQVSALMAGILNLPLL
jgi:hypothetical protein